jgi:Family of unknown function (DUF6364)
MDMETKLTLRMDEKIIEAAKVHAQKQRVSLSKLVADYLQMISSKSVSAATFKPTPILSEITGVLPKSSSKKDLQNEYHKYLEEKYL